MTPQRLTSAPPTQVETVAWLAREFHRDLFQHPRQRNGEGEERAVKVGGGDLRFL